MSTEPRFANSANIPAPEWTVMRGGRHTRLTLAVRYAVFEHDRFGRCLVDTGYSRRVTEGPRRPMLSLYTRVLSPRLTDAALPGAVPDVDTILLSHLHADHISAVRDYPRARIFLHGGALDHLSSLGRWAQLRHGFFAELLPDDILSRVTRIETLPVRSGPLGIGEGHDLFGDGSVLAIPLPGHMIGHMGFLWPKLTPALLYAVDVQWVARAVMEDRMPGPPLRWIQGDTAAARASATRVAAFVRAGGRAVYCHEPDPAP